MPLNPLSRHSGSGELAFRDVRDWEVRTRQGDDAVGKVHDVLVDENGRARYLDVALAASSKHTLVPTGHLSTAEEGVVHVPGTGDRFSTLPVYAHSEGGITPEYEAEVARTWDESYSNTYDRPDYRTSWARGTDRDATGQLARLDQLDDYEVADYDADPRGWEVIGRDGRRIGEVDHLIGDTGAMKVRYLTVDMDREIGDRKVLVPVGHARLEEDERVRVDALDAEAAGRLPAYEGTVDRDYERGLHEHFERGYTAEHRYGHPRYEDRSLRTSR